MFMYAVIVCSLGCLVIFYFHVHSGVNELIGILVGHLYYFLKYRYPEEYGGRELLHTPEIL